MINSELFDLYSRNLDSLVQMENELDEQAETEPEANNYAGPYLTYCWESNYNQSNKKILFVGQESMGWYCEYTKSESDLRDAIDVYKEFECGRGKASPYWRAVHYINEKINPGMELNYVCTNIDKFGKGDSAGKPIQDVLDKETEYFNVLIDEINILNPDVVIFFTGPNYDENIEDKLGFVSFEAVGNHTSFEFAQVISDALPELSFRVNHPNNLQLTGRWNILDEIVDLIQNRSRTRISNDENPNRNIKADIKGTAEKLKSDDFKKKEYVSEEEKKADLNKKANILAKLVENLMIKLLCWDREFKIGILGGSDNDRVNLTEMLFNRKEIKRYFRFSNNIKELESECKVIWSISGDTSETIKTYVIKSLDEDTAIDLIEWTIKNLSLGLRNTFKKMQKFDIDAKKKAAHIFIAEQTAVSGGYSFTSSFVGFSFSDSYMLAANEIVLMARVFNIYNIEDITGVIKSIGFSELIKKLLTDIGKAASAGIINQVIDTAADGAVVIGGVGVPVKAVKGGINAGVAAVVILGFGEALNGACYALCKSALKRDKEEFEKIYEHFGEAVVGCTCENIKSGKHNPADYNSIDYSAYIEKLNSGITWFENAWNEANKDWKTEQKRSSDLNNQLDDLIASL